MLGVEPAEPTRPSEWPPCHRRRRNSWLSVYENRHGTRSDANRKRLGWRRPGRIRAEMLDAPRRVHSRPVWSTALWRNIEDSSAITSSRRRRFTRLAVRTFWADCLWRKPWRKFDSPHECLEADYCFACGMLWSVATDRSHIVARVWGGQDELSDIHLLCPLCHEMSEMYQGMSYWRWLRRQSQFEAIRWGMSRALWVHGLGNRGCDTELRLSSRSGHGLHVSRQTVAGSTANLGGLHERPFQRRNHLYRFRSPLESALRHSRRCGIFHRKRTW